MEQAFGLNRYWTIHYGVNGKLPFTLGRAQMHFFAYKIRGCYLLRERNSSDNVQDQFSEHLLKSNGGYCLDYPSNIYHNTKTGKYHSGIAGLI